MNIAQSQVAKIVSNVKNRIRSEINNDGETSIGQRQVSSIIDNRKKRIRSEIHNGNKRTHSEISISNIQNRILSEMNNDGGERIDC